MTNADEMRASDADREKVVQALQGQVGEGRLTLPEFEERSGAAYTAKTIGDLRVLTKDLPVDPLAPPPGPTHPWEQPFPLPSIPPWAQRTFPQRPLPPARRAGPFATVMLVLVGLLVVQGILAVAAHVFFPIIPLVFLLFVLGPRRRRYR
ncbi:MAG TPA: DUF1707 domain-containing protein [Pseudonocardiaceae bacterium]|jgi:hypothetical protein|nr:DUF1707 domain-containing protein [Pseudonocardiaceae bacterium]